MLTNCDLFASHTLDTTVHSTLVAMPENGYCKLDLRYAESTNEYETTQGSCDPLANASVDGEFFAFGGLWMSTETLGKMILYTNGDKLMRSKLRVSFGACSYVWMVAG